MPRVEDVAGTLHRELTWRDVERDVGDSGEAEDGDVGETGESGSEDDSPARGSCAAERKGRGHTIQLGSTLQLPLPKCSAINSVPKVGKCAAAIGTQFVYRPREKRC